MNRIWGELYPYGDFTGIRLAIENDYVLQLKDQEGWTSVEGMASGGERSMAALALRVAFSMAFIPNLRWLILDEPTHNLDTNAIDYLTEALRDRISSFAEQVFLITHDDRVSEGVGGNLYRLERNKERNEPTRIAETGIPGM
jgi:exonuclease SbcC